MIGWLLRNRRKGRDQSAVVTGDTERIDSLACSPSLVVHKTILDAADGRGHGNGLGDGDGDGDGDGCGDGDRHGHGFGHGDGRGCFGDGFGRGDGSAEGYGSDSGYGFGFDPNDDPETVNARQMSESDERTEQ